MAAYLRVYDSRHLQADCKEPGSASEPYARQLSMGYLCLTSCLHIMAINRRRGKANSQNDSAGGSRNLTLQRILKLAHHGETPTGMGVVCYLRLRCSA